MKTILSFAVIIALFFSCAERQDHAEEQPEHEPSFSFVEGHKPVWELAITQVVEIAEAMPEENYAFSPHDSVRTFAEQLVHIGGSSKVIANLFLKDIQPDFSQSPDIEGMSKSEIISMVRTNLEETWAIMETMSDEQLDEEVKSFAGNTMTRREGLMLVHDHLTNHKAKANLYVRISGHEPPAYRYY